MPWKINSAIGERWRLVRSLLRNEESLSHWCRVFGIRRKTAYKWRARFTHGGRGALRDRSRRPRRQARRLHGRWRHRICRVRRQHPHWGPKKIRAWFQWHGGVSPSQRSIARMLGRLRLVRKVWQHTRKAGVGLRWALTMARHANEVWTVDFKGWFRTGNGQRCEPLTVRDLFSRYGLLVRLLPDQRWRPVRAQLRGLFRRAGLPEVIRVDNGGPFGSKGAAGLSRLSVWWLRLGIQVEFIRRGHPEDNGAHEQFHRVMKRETTVPVARTRRGQQRRTSLWLADYNRVRPHEGLGQKRPVQLYHRSRRRYPESLVELKYAAGWAVRRVRSNGQIKWHGRMRFIGETFVGQNLGLRVLRTGVQAVNFGPLLIGHLYESDVGGMRPMVYRHRRTAFKKRKV
jgi:putative transposase